MVRQSSPDGAIPGNALLISGAGPRSIPRHGLHVFTREPTKERPMPIPMAPDLHALAQEMKAAQDAARQVEPFTTRLPGFDLRAAYEVADLMHRARLAEGAKPVGRKIGFTNPAMWDRFGVREPIWAYVYDTTVVQLEGTRTSCRLGRFVEPKIEPEIVVHFHSAPPPGAGPEGVLNAIDWVAHGFEIVQSHFPAGSSRRRTPLPTGRSTARSWSVHRSPWLGSELTSSQHSRPSRSRLSCDGREIETGRGSNVLGSPLAAIAHLVSLLAKQSCYTPLQAGELVTTGTITTARSVRAGETWQSELRGIALPGLTVEFSA